MTSVFLLLFCLTQQETTFLLRLLLLYTFGLDGLLMADILSL